MNIPHHGHNRENEAYDSGNQQQLVAFLVTFSVLLGGAVVWLGLFAWLIELQNEMLRTVAQWISPERISGWIFYLAICAIGFVPIARRFLRRGRQMK